MSHPAKKSASDVSRRKFIKAAGVTAVAFGVAPAFLRAEEPVVVGSGTHKYEWVRDWPKLPEGRNYGNAHSVQVTADGRFIIHHQGGTGDEAKGAKDSVCIFDPDGKFIESWGKEYTGGAHGLQLRKEGNEEFLYLATTGQKKVIKTDLKGKVIWMHDGPPKEHEAYAAKKLGYSPTNIALLPGEGDIYVADGYGSSFVHQYTKDGKYVRVFGGGKTKELGSLNSPHGICIDSRGKEPVVCVADRSNHRLQNFTLEGKPINLVTDELRSPCHFDIFGTDLLIPDLEGRVTIFDGSNKLITHLGDNPDAKKRGPAGHKMPPTEWKDGLFHNPHGACYDKAGNIYVTEWLVPIGRVTKLKKLA